VGEPDVDAAADRARGAWVSALEAHVRAAKKHEDAATLHARQGGIQSGDRRNWIVWLRSGPSLRLKLARHPEWANDAPDWPQLDPDDIGG
jgi:hypothetical protein